MTPFGRSRQRNDEPAAPSGNGELPAEPPRDTAVGETPPGGTPRFPAPPPKAPPSPPRRFPAPPAAVAPGTTSPWGPVGGPPAPSTAAGQRSAPSFPPRDAHPAPVEKESEPPPAPEPVNPPDLVALPHEEPVASANEPSASPTIEPAPALADVDPSDRPTFRGPLESALRHPLLAIVPTIVLVGVAAAIGLTRDPTYTAESDISVGRVDVPAFTLQGVTIGNATLASGYARTIDAEAVVGPAGNAVGLSPSEARDRLSASQIPKSTLIRVEADGPNQTDAVSLANAGSRSLINYIEDLNREQQTSGLLRQFRSARGRLERAKTTLERALRDPRPSDTRVEKARLDLAAAQLQAETIGNQYRSLQGGPEPQNVMQLIAPAAEAKSDRRSMFQRLLLIGMAAGILVGLTLALLRENSRLIGRRGT